MLVNRVITFILIGVFLCNFLIATPPILTSHQVGQYAGRAWGAADVPPPLGSFLDRTNLLRYTIRSINVNQDDPNDWPDLSAIVQNIYEGQDYSPKRTMLPRIHFWDGADRYSLPMRDISVYKARLDYACSQLEPVMDLIHGISLSEENVPHTGHTAVLEELYWHVKNQYPDLPVYQWWSPNTAVPTRHEGIYLSADGWIIDTYTLNIGIYPETWTFSYFDGSPYNFGPDPYLRLLRNYVITGKPVLSMIWASANQPWWYDASDPQNSMAPDTMWDQVEHQRTINKAFNISTSYYWVKETAFFPLVTGDPLQDAITADVRDHAFDMIWLDPSWTGDPAIADVWDNTPVGISLSGSTYFTDGFSNPKIVGYTSGRGFRDLVHNGSDLRVRGFNGRNIDVEIVWHFIADAVMNYPVVSLDVEVNPGLNGQLKMSASIDGVTWPIWVQSSSTTGIQNLVLQTGTEADFASRSDLWFKIEITGNSGSIDTPAVRLDNLAMQQGSEVLGCGSWGYKISDLNKDCSVNLQDFAILLEYWQKCTDPVFPESCINANP